MRRVLQRYEKPLQAAGLLCLRVGLGGMMLGLHGWGKFASFPEGAAGFPDPLGIGSAATLTLAVFTEVFCSVFVILGLGTRLAAVPLLITMLVAGFIHHADDPFSIREKALLYGIGFLVLVFTGPGPWSVDAWLRPKLEAWWSRPAR